MGCVVLEPWLCSLPLHPTCLPRAQAHVKLTSPFLCLPASVLVRSEMASSSGFWLSGCLAALVFLRLPAPLSGRSW